MEATGIPAVDAAVVWSVAAAALAGGAAVVWRFFRGARRLAAKLDDFVDDWTGIPSRPGVPERPGVMARLARIEHELQPNSSLSLRDAVDRIEERLGTGPDS